MEKMENGRNLKRSLAIVLATSFLFNALVVCFVAYSWTQMKTDYSRLENEIELIKTKFDDCARNQRLNESPQMLSDAENHAELKRQKREVISSGKVDLGPLLRGAPGPIGPTGPPGKDGKDGRDGKDFTSLSVLRDVIDERVTSEWSKLSSSLPIYGGATYFHWGRSSCPDKSALIYKGMITGPDLISPGGGSDLQCLPDDPEYDPAAPSGVPHSSLKPAWLQVGFSENMFGRPMTRRHIPCAACETIQRVSKIIIPAKVRCPSGWTLEYKGYLVSAAEGNLPADYFKTGHFRVNYVCMDSKIESLNSTTPDWSGTPLYAVAAHATGGGALPNIPPYKSDYTALSCVVCSK